MIGLISAFLITAAFGGTPEAPSGHIKIRPVAPPLKPFGLEQELQCNRDMAKIDAVLSCAIQVPGRREATDACRKNYEAAFEGNGTYDQIVNDDYSDLAKPSGEPPNLPNSGSGLDAYGAVDAAALGWALARTLGGKTSLPGWLVTGAFALTEPFCNLGRSTSGFIFCSKETIRPWHLQILKLSKDARDKFLNLRPGPNSTSDENQMMISREIACKQFHSIAEAYSKFYSVKVNCYRYSSNLGVGSDLLEGLKFGIHFNEEGDMLLSRDLHRGEPESNDPFDQHMYSTINLNVPAFTREHRRFKMNGGIPILSSVHKVSVGPREKPFPDDQAIWLLRPKLLKHARKCKAITRRTGRTTGVAEPAPEAAQ